MAFQQLGKMIRGKRVQRKHSKPNQKSRQFREMHSVKNINAVQKNVSIAI